MKFYKKCNVVKIDCPRQSEKETREGLRWLVGRSTRRQSGEDAIESDDPVSHTLILLNT